MNNFLKILVFSLTLFSCKQQTENTTAKPFSVFNLKTDIAAFKTKMSEYDTIHVLITSGACQQIAYKKLEITKKSDSIKIRSEFLDGAYHETEGWKFGFEKKIHKSDTTWKFGEFLVKNKYRQIIEERESVTIEINFKNDKIKFYSKDLSDKFRLIEAYYNTMITLHAENTGDNYGVETISIDTLLTKQPDKPINQ